MQLAVNLDPSIEEELKEIHPRFHTKLVEWIRDFKEHGLYETRIRWKDHPMNRRFRGEVRNNVWSIALNHRYRVLYKAEESRVTFLRVEKHNKEFY